MMEREQSAERGVAERERSGERAESSAQRPFRSRPTVALLSPSVTINLNFDWLTDQSMSTLERLEF